MYTGIYRPYRPRSQTKCELKSLSYRRLMCHVLRILNIWKHLDLAFGVSYDLAPVSLLKFTFHHFAAMSYYKLLPKHASFRYHFFSLAGIPDTSCLLVFQVYVPCATFLILVWCLQGIVFQFHSSRVFCLCYYYYYLLNIRSLKTEPTARTSCPFCNGSHTVFNAMGSH